MRAIKFRTFMGERFLYWGFIDGNFIGATDKENAINEQFAGLLDKNGVEIYEHDLCTDHNGMGIVEYSEKYAAFRINYQDGLCKWFYDYTLKGERESIEVVGNIHEGKP